MHSIQQRMGACWHPLNKWLNKWRWWPKYSTVKPLYLYKVKRIESLATCKFKPTTKQL